MLAIPHPEWNGILEDGSNLAILKLDEETCISPVSSMGENSAENRRDLTVLSYGSSAGNPNYSPDLMYALFDTYNATYCNERYRLEHLLTEQELCGKQESSVGICHGDAGSPLVLNPTLQLFRDVLIGVASYATASCDSTEGVSVFTNIWHYKDWINETRENTHDLENCSPLSFQLNLKGSLMPKLRRQSPSIGGFQFPACSPFDTSLGLLCQLCSNAASCIIIINF